jgi:hypothetical protein
MLRVVLWMPHGGGYILLRRTLCVARRMHVAREFFGGCMVFGCCVLQAADPRDIRVVAEDGGAQRGLRTRFQGPADAHLQPPVQEHRGHNGPRHRLGMNSSGSTAMRLPVFRFNVTSSRANPPGFGSVCSSDVA